MKTWKEVNSRANRKYKAEGRLDKTKDLGVLCRIASLETQVELYPDNEKYKGL